MGVHEQVCHGGKTRMEKYLVEHGSHVLRPVIQLFLDLCQICQATRGRKSTRKIVHKPIIPDTVGQRGQAELVDLQMVPDNGTEFSNKTLWPGLMNSGRVQRSCTAGHATRRTRGVWSGLMETSRTCSTPDSGM